MTDDQILEKIRNSYALTKLKPLHGCFVLEIENTTVGACGAANCYLAFEVQPQRKPKCWLQWASLFFGRTIGFVQGLTDGWDGVGLSKPKSAHYVAGLRLGVAAREELKPVEYDDEQFHYRYATAQTCVA